MKKIQFLTSFCLSVLFLSALSLSSFAEVEKQMQELNSAMNALEKDISELEESLLFPPVTRVKVFLSLANDTDFILHSVSLRIDNREQSYHIYSSAELDALRLGGIQSLWEGNVALGERRLLARVVGEDRRGEKVSYEATLDFEKTLQGRALELQILGGKKVQFSVQDWGAK